MPKRALHQTAEAQCLSISSNQLHVVEDEVEDEEELDDDPLTLELEPELPVVLCLFEAGPDPPCGA
jgi:hypothetical protein